MIKIPKKRLYKFSFFSILTKHFHLKFVAYAFLFSVLFIFLPVYISASFTPHPVYLLTIFYILNIIILLFCVNNHLNKKYKLRAQNEDLQERLNVLNDDNLHEFKNRGAIQEKIRRYSSLKNIIEQMNQSLSLDSVADYITLIAFESIAKNRGVCLLYMVDSQNNVKLHLFKTKKEDEKLVIKAKEGNVFDFWVLRHATPLLIEDIKKDFRFDLEKLLSREVRQVSSLISSPLISEHRFLGILRLDHQDVGFYSQDDLRFLVTICDLGAVALENSELFQRTQDLAIHDALTSLFTKGYFLERLKDTCKRSLRKPFVFSLLMLDIDYFKNYNDKFGHTAGDIVLNKLSSIITSSLKGYDCLICRFGGEEFCVILERLDKKKAREIAEKLRIKIENEKIVLRRQPTNITVSIGISTFPEDAREADELIIKSDRAMYKAKQKGRNLVVAS